MPVSAGIFLNYRREDASHAAARLYDQLLKHFGPEAIFMDIDSVPVGKDFTESIANALDACSVFLAIIGSTWVNVKDSMGNRRLKDPNDYVRLEIQAALRRGISVIPVLIDNAEFPNPLELPESLRPLLRLNGLRLRHESFRTDIDRLVSEIDRISGSTKFAPDPTPAAVRQRIQGSRHVHPSHPQQEPQLGDPHYFEDTARRTLGLGPRPDSDN